MFVVICLNIVQSRLHVSKFQYLRTIIIILKTFSRFKYMYMNFHIPSVCNSSACTTSLDILSKRNYLCTCCCLRNFFQEYFIDLTKSVCHWFYNTPCWMLHVLRTPHIYNNHFLSNTFESL